MTEPIETTMASRLIRATGHGIQRLEADRTPVSRMYRTTIRCECGSEVTAIGLSEISGVLDSAIQTFLSHLGDRVEPS